MLRSLLRSLGAVQLDTISVLARSHELVAHSRLGAIDRSAIESTYWDAQRPARTYEYWAHAACVLPAEDWPWFGFRRRHYRAKGWRWGETPANGEAIREKILTRLRDEGPLSATDLGGARREVGAEWWGWSDIKIAVEWLLDVGDVVCVERRGWRRIYDLPERVLPSHTLNAEPSDEECLIWLVRTAGRALGVATISDLADYYRLGRREVESVVEASGLTPVAVVGWDGARSNSAESNSAESNRAGSGRARANRASSRRAGLNAPPAAAWADPDALDAPPRGRHRTTLLSPFDSLIWERRRTARLFGWTNRLEAYKPAADRQHGYFVMPLLSGGKLLGRVDPKRVGHTLVARQLSLETASAIEPMADALVEAASWVGSSTVAVDRVTPDSAREPLRAAIAARIA